MHKVRFKRGFFILLILVIFINFSVKESFGIADYNKKDGLIQSADKESTNSGGEASVIVEFSKKPKNYKQIIESMGGKIIQDSDRCAAFQEFFHDMRTDEACSTGNQGMHVVIVLET